MPTSKDDIISLCEELLSLHGKENGPICADTAEFYSALAIVRNILELIKRYNDDPENAVKLPYPNNLRNKITHFSFMVSANELSDFIDEYLNMEFIKNIQQPTPHLDEAYFENTELYTSLKQYNTQPDNLNTFVENNTNSYTYHCMHYLEKFIYFFTNKHISPANQYAAQFAIEQSIEMIERLQKVLPTFEIGKEVKAFHDQFIRRYKQFRRNQAHKGFIDVNLLTHDVKNIQQVLDYFTRYFLRTGLEPFRPSGKSTSSRGKIVDQDFKKQLESHDKKLKEQQTQQALTKKLGPKLMLEIQRKKELLLQQREKNQQQELLKKLRVEQPDAEISDKLKSTKEGFLLPFEKPFDEAWFTDDEMNYLIDYFVNKDNCRCMVGINVEQLKGETFRDSLLETISQMTALELQTEMRQDTIVVPINLGDKHWTALHIYFDSGDKAKPSILYVDPYGTEKMPKELQSALQQVFPALPEANIIVFQFKFQSDTYNCGPWVIAILDKLVKDGMMPDEKLNINEARKYYREILNARLEGPRAAELTPVLKREIKNIDVSQTENSLGEIGAAYGNRDSAPDTSVRLERGQSPNKKRS